MCRSCSAGQCGCGTTVHERETTAYDDFTIRLPGEGIHVSVHRCHKVGIERAVGVWPGQIRDGLAIHGADGAADQDCVVGLDQQGIG